MGTRADFYVGVDENAEWLGSIAWDGYPDGISLTLATHRVVPGIKMEVAGQNIVLPDIVQQHHREFVKGRHLFDSKTEKDYRRRVVLYFKNRDDVSLPEHGWPWPWDNSGTTDYAYAFNPALRKVVVSGFGSPYLTLAEYHKVLKREEKKDYDESPYYQQSKSQVFPDMKERKNVALGYRSGLIVVGG